MLYALCLIAATKSAIQPTIKHTPPIGVIGPITDRFSSPSKFLVLSRYSDPENRRIPRVNMMKDTRIDWLFALENVDKKSRANV